MAVEELGEYVSKVMRRIIVFPRYMRYLVPRYQNYRETFSHLNEDLQRYVPPDRALEITLVLIRHVCQTYIDVMRNTDFKDSCEEIAPVVLKSVIHPSVKSIDNVRCASHRKLFDYYKIYNCDLLYKTLPLLRDLEALRLGPANRTDDTPLDVRGFRDSLKGFASRSCKDSDIETLASNCRHLRYLDISDSSDISDRIVDHILMFECLEELNLCNVSSLSSEALQLILNGLSEVELSGSGASPQNVDVFPSGSKDFPKDSGVSTVGCPSSASFRSQLLKSFGWTCATKKHIETISQKFPNLTSLSLSNIHRCLLTPLRQLKYLQQFTLIDSSFFLVQELLTAIGSQLKCLKIVDVFGADFDFICQKCPSLICLHISFSLSGDLRLPRNYWKADPRKLPVQVIPSVEFLQLELDDLRAVKYILNHFRNLKKLFMGYNSCDKKFIDGIIQRKYMTHLEEFFWGNNVAVKFHGMIATVRCFQNDGSAYIHSEETL
jgi:hypothetical protein